MTGLLWTMLRARAGIAVMTLVLSALAVAAAITGPLYADAAMRSVIEVEVGAAPLSERVLTADRLDRNRLGGFVAPREEGGKDLEHQPFMHGFETRTSVMSEGVIHAAGQLSPLWLASRTGICAHLEIAEGRCATADRELVLRQDTASALGVRAGSEVDYAASSFGGGPPDGSVKLTVVGIYRPYLATDIYWADRVTFHEETPVAFANERTVESNTGPLLRVTDLLATPAAFTDRDRLRSETFYTSTILEAAGYATQTEVEALAGRIDDAGDALLASLLVATLPLVAICCYVLAQAVAGAVRRRRPELAVTALRGVPGRLRWALPGGETLLPVLLGAFLGILIGYFTSFALARIRLPHKPPVVLTWQAFALGAAAALAAVLAGGLAQASVMREPVLELLRRVRRRRGERWVRVAEVASGALALAAGYQAATAGSDGSSSVALLVPLCFALGIGLLAGRLVLKPTEVAGRWLARRGWLSFGLAALSLARRPGSRGIVALLTVGFGLLGFAVVATDTAERAWDRRARTEIGAERVLSIGAVPPGRLLEAVRTVDPEGRFAMAGIQFTLGQAPPILALDSTRFARVGIWPTASAPALSALRPVEPKPLYVQGSEVVITATLDSIAPGATARLDLSVLKPDGRPAGLLGDEMRPGKAVYKVASPECAVGTCRLVAVGISLSTLGRHQISVTLHDLNGNPAPFADPSLWLRQEETAARPVAAVKTGPQGLNLSADSAIAVDLKLRVAAAPEPLPVITTQDPPAGLPSPEIVPVAGAGRSGLLPRLGANGILMDLEYADLLLRPRAENTHALVFLNDAAPDDILQRLRANGLAVQDDVRARDRLDLYRRQGPALALGFLRLAALAALILAAAGLLAAAALDRADSQGFTMLVPHGLRARILRRAAFTSRVSLVLIAAVAGLGAAAAAWAAGRHIVPVFPASLPGFPVDSLPTPQATTPLAVAAFALLLTAWLAARISRSPGGNQS